MSGNFLDRSAFRGLFLLGLAGSLLSHSQAGLVSEPAGDRWMYWFGDVNGARAAASVYGAYGTNDYAAYNFDDRHGQMFLDFDTTSLAPKGQGATNYTVSLLKIRLVVNYGNVFRYDPTFDSLATYRGGQVDSDLGRPIELYGVGYRGGFSLETFRENSPYQTSGSVGNRGVRNAYAMDFISGSPTDVSNNVEENFEVRPWAVGQITGQLDIDGTFSALSLSPGTIVPVDAVMVFTVDLSDPSIRSYVQQGLHAGRLHFMVTSLYEAQQQVEAVPSFHTKEAYWHRRPPYSELYLATQMEATVAIGSSSTPDSDQDGLLDSWESQYFGNLLRDGTQDANGNGMTDAEEYLWGTNPTETGGKKPAPSIAAQGAGFTVTFPTVVGRTYQVQFKDYLTADAWQPLGSPTSGTGDAHVISDSEPSPAGRRFYRLEVRISP